MSVGGCDVSKCREFLKSIEDFPDIKKLLDGLKGGKPKIYCRPCSSTGEEGNARAALFNSLPVEIVLCTNRLSENSLKEALTHELVHAYDYTNNRCNFAHCDGLAYTEIRAAREAECAGYYPFQFMRDYCIKVHATRSTENLFSNASKCVDNVFDIAVQDRAPMQQPVSISTSASDSKIGK